MKKPAQQQQRHARQQSPQGPGTLYVTATPIGNLEDLGHRAVRILREADIVACEDTRHTRKLLSHLGINARLVSYYRQRERSRGRELISALEEGKDVALVSDAGTPCLADPGSLLVRTARARGIPVRAVAGPSALAAALSVSGLDDEGFVFLGFLPAKAGRRRRLLAGLADSPRPLVCFVPPHSLVSALADCLEVLGQRDCLLCRELTKIHEECIERPAEELLEQVRENPLKGEMVLIIQPRGREPGPTAAECRDLLRELRDAGLSLRDAVRRACEECGRSRSFLYRQALMVWPDREEKE